MQPSNGLAPKSEGSNPKPLLRNFWITFPNGNHRAEGGEPRGNHSYLPQILSCQRYRCLDPIVCRHKNLTPPKFSSRTYQAKRRWDEDQPPLPNGKGRAEDRRQHTSPLTQLRISTLDRSYPPPNPKLMKPGSTTLGSLSPLAPAPCRDLDAWAHEKSFRMAEAGTCPKFLPEDVKHSRLPRCQDQDPLAKAKTSSDSINRARGGGFHFLTFLKPWAIQF